MQGKWTHGLSRINGKKRKLYSVWIAMKSRCNNKTDKNYPSYGGRGIIICKEWDDYVAFHEWAMSNRYRKGLTLDRIDNNKGYSPENCHWVTMQQQSYNKRNSAFLVYNGIKKTFGEWQNLTGINRRTIQSRIEHGWTPEKALTTTPIRRKVA